LGVDTTDLDKGMQSLGNKIKQHQKAIGMGMVAAGGAILAAGALSVKTFAEMGDEVHKMALRTGFATEALSRLKYAAEIGGASLDDIEKAAKRMSMSILDAKDGLAETTRSFNKIGIAVEDLEGLSPEEQFMKIAGALANVEDATEKAALAQKLFGKAGTALLPMLADGTAGLKAMMEEAEKFAPIFDEEAAAAAAKLTDLMGELSGATTKVKMVIAEQLVPILIPLIQNIRDAVAGISAWAEKYPGLTRVIILGTFAMAGLLIALGTLLLIMPGISAAVTLLTGQVGINTIAWVKNTVAKVAATIATKAATIATGLLALGVGALTLVLAGLLVGLGMIAFGVWQLIAAHKEHEKWLKSNAEYQEEYNKALRGEANSYAEVLDARMKDIETRKAMGKATSEEIEWLRLHGEESKQYIAYMREGTAAVQEHGTAQQMAGRQAVSAIQATSDVSQASMQQTSVAAGLLLIQTKQIVAQVDALMGKEYLEEFGGTKEAAWGGGAPEPSSDYQYLLEKYGYGGWIAYKKEAEKIGWKGPVLEDEGDIERGYVEPDKYEPPWWDISEFQHGGIAMRPQLARIAEREPEAVIPISKLEQIMQTGAVGSTPVSVVIEGDVLVRDEQDINRLADRISQSIGYKLSQRKRIRG